MATFLVETYLPRAAAGEPDATIRRAIAAATASAASGEAVAYLRSIFIPEDETCMLLFEADGEDVVRVIAMSAGIDPDRVSRADDRPARG